MSEKKEELKFIITESFLNEILGVLGKLPYVQVAALLEKAKEPNIKLLPTENSLAKEPSSVSAEVSQ